MKSPIVSTPPGDPVRIASRDRVVLRPSANDLERRRSTVRHAFRRGFRRFALGPKVPAPNGAERVEVHAREFTAPGPVRVPRRRVAAPGDLTEALAVGRRYGSVAIAWTGDRVIPLENLLAARKGTFEVWVESDEPAEVPGLLGALERGADLVVVGVDSPEAVDRLEAVLDADQHGPVLWGTATITGVGPSGLGDRVLLDTTSLLGPSEGLAVGSVARAMFHVLSEAVGSRYTRPRRFRVNAGGPHSYVLMADRSTRYLSELEPGEELCALDVDGRPRGVRLGRLKIERRPLVLVEAEVEGRSATVFLQEAETVRLSGPGGAKAVTDLAEGDIVRILLSAPARHLGIVVDETIEER